MTTIIEVQERGLKVRMNNQITLISKHKDEKGEYFLNENLQKQYFQDTVFETEEVEAVEVVKSVKEEKQAFTFEVEYQHNGRPNGFALKTTTVEAYSYEEAIEKVKKRFAVIYEISEA
jgi:hypothetical protein